MDTPVFTERRRLDSVEVGDNLVTFSYGHRARFHKVVRVTKTQITIEGGTVVSKNTRRKVGCAEKYGRPFYQVATDEDSVNDAAARHRSQVENEFNGLVTQRSYTVEQLEAVITILKPKAV